MNIASNLPGFNPQAHGSAPQVGQPVNIRVSFEPVTAQDRTLMGMTQYMMRQIGVGSNVNVLA